MQIENRRRRERLWRDVMNPKLIRKVVVANPQLAFVLAKQTDVFVVQQRFATAQKTAGRFYDEVQYANL